MFFEGAHTTTYVYSQPVFLEPQVIRLRPRCDVSQRLLHYELHLDPEPAGRSEYLEVEGNETTNVWFEGKTQRLTIITSLGVETLQDNPFAYLLEPDALRLPIVYASDIAPLLTPYQARYDDQDSVATFAHDIAKGVGSATIPFLNDLAQTIHDTCSYIVRPDGPPWSAEQTLGQKQGACRDLATLFIAACRVLGLAARFVSGYQGGHDVLSPQQLHAWVEVYLPGAGWRGYDPTLGLTVADHHVALAASAAPIHAAPTYGTFRGTGATATLNTDIQLRMATSPPVSRRRAED